MVNQLFALIMKIPFLLYFCRSVNFYVSSLKSLTRNFFHDYTIYDVEFSQKKTHHFVDMDCLVCWAKIIAQKMNDLLRSALYREFGLLE